MWQRKFPFKALIAIFWDLQPLWPSSLTKPDLLRLIRVFSRHVLSKTKSVIPHFLNISDINNSSSFNSKIFRKNSMLENFGANVLNSCVAFTTRQVADFSIDPGARFWKLPIITGPVKLFPLRMGVSKVLKMVQ